jgi:Protein of unknown function (DUF3303)
MKFLVQWNGPPSAQQAAIERFLKTRGLPPDHIKLLGRWHSIGELGGCAIVESDDTAAMTAWMIEWGDVFSFKVTPAVTDEELGAALAAQQLK